MLNLITLQLGADVMVAIKAKMREVGSAPDLAEAINRCGSTLCEAFPQVKWVFFEPDLHERVDWCSLAGRCWAEKDIRAL